MDPNQQPPRPNQRTPYISDFVAKPRADFVAPPRQQQPATPPTPQSTSTPSQPAPALQQSIPQVQAQPAAQDSPSTTSHYTSFEPPRTAEASPRIPKVNNSHQGLRDILSIFGVLASALILAFCLISFVFQSYQVDGPSMQTTLQNNDHLIVWKVPKTFANLTGQNYIPNRGDVVVFNEQTADSVSGKQLIKRVIGLPGERVVVKNNEVVVYNKDFPNGFSPDKTLPYGKAIVSTPGNVDVTLDEDEVYAIGDNRSNSLDSRVFGPVQSKQIVGKLVLRVLPLNTATKF
jgi:signal peptidase I